MKAIKAAIFAALNHKAALGTVSSSWPPSDAKYPYTSYYRVSGSGENADGVFAAWEELYSVDCFAKSMTETEDMEAAANDAMNTLPYIVLAEPGPDLYEKETKIFHKVLRYRIKS